MAKNILNFSNKVWILPYLIRPLLSLKFFKMNCKKRPWKIAIKAKTKFMMIFMNSTWLRKRQHKTGWAISNVACRCRRAAARRPLLFCQKLGGQLPTLPTRHLRPCRILHFSPLSCSRFQSNMYIRKARKALKATFFYYQYNIRS